MGGCGQNRTQSPEQPGRDTQWKMTAGEKPKGRRDDREEGNLERGNERKDGFGFHVHKDRKENTGFNQAGLLIKTSHAVPLLLWRHLIT